MNNAATEFNQNGYWVAQSVLDEAECKTIEASLHGIKERGDRSLLEKAWCRDAAYRIRDRLSDAMRCMNDLEPVQCTLFQKDRAKNWLVAWHQDRSLPAQGNESLTKYAVREKGGQVFTQPSASILHEVVAVRLGIDLSNSDNGGLRVLPGTHVDGVLSAEEIALKGSLVAPDLPEVPRGGALLMRPLLIHGSSKSRSDCRRRILHFVFAKNDL